MYGRIQIQLNTENETEPVKERINRDHAETHYEIINTRITQISCSFCRLLWGSSQGRNSQAKLNFNVFLISFVHLFWLCKLAQQGDVIACPDETSRGRCQLKI